MHSFHHHRGKERKGKGPPRPLFEFDLCSFCVATAVRTGVAGHGDPRHTRHATLSVSSHAAAILCFRGEMYLCFHCMTVCAHMTGVGAKQSEIPAALTFLLL